MQEHGGQEGLSPGKRCRRLPSRGSEILQRNVFIPSLPTAVRMLISSGKRADKEGDNRNAE
jgi:hypothetical protein